MKKESMFEQLKNNWQKDILSGFIVSLIALPLSLGIAGACGFPPIMGVLTAIVGGIIVSFFMGCELTIKGPAAGLIVIVYGAVEEFAKASNGNMDLGWKLALSVVVIAGAIQILLGLLKVAAVVEFFPLSAVHGMLAAIGIIIMSKQIHFAVGTEPALLKGKEPLELLKMIPESLAHLAPQIAIIGGISLLILFGMPLIKNKFVKKIPPALVVLVVGVILGQVQNLGSPEFANLKPLVSPGDLFSNFGVKVDFSGISSITGVFVKYLILFVMIGSLESLLSSKAIDLLDPQRRKSNFNKDLTAVGIGNMVSGLFGGLPMISEIARSSANINNGGRTRWANFFHGVFLLLFIAVLLPFIKMVPVASLAAMLIFVGFRLASPKEFVKTFKVGIDQFIVFIGTILITISTDLLMGIFSGIIIEWIIYVSWGIPFKDYFRPKMSVEHKSGDLYIVTLKGSGMFSNFIYVNKQLMKIGEGKTIQFDVSAARLLDHTFLENMHHFEAEYKHRGGNFSFVGMDNLNPKSSHPHSAKKGNKKS